MNSKCMLCPRNCGVDRTITLGVCQVSNKVKIARAALHFWEEPCISGTKGSGAVFFSGCSLHCVFCQNEKISHGQVGKEVTIDELAEIYLDLQNQGANNINLVTGTHYIPQIVESIKIAKANGLEIPIIYNTSGYEKADSLKQLDGIVNTYLPDFKYMDSNLAAKYSHAADYPEVAKEAIAEMVRQCGTPVFDDNGFIQSGVIVRQLLLPGHVKDAKAIVKYLYETYGDNIYISMMSQYTPMPQIASNYPELNRRVTKREYDSLIDYALSIGVENAFIQDRTVAKESFIPEFDNEL
ncbi:radical SAM protein [Pseudobutyrivibrio ruminis]|uniref:radical SAM protein n=1 Tax=Pseudobutyrivibrio ruminis TaxID=46206 RepID=UPI000484B03C|nr:radical SAM protein [Pseudobutyrivibrio ruminis]